MTAYLMRRPDGTLRVVHPDTDGVFPEAVDDLTQSTGDVLLCTVPIVTLAEYTEELTRELEEVREWLRQTEARKLANTLRATVTRYNARKAAGAVHHG